MSDSPKTLTLDLFTEWLMKDVKIHFTKDDMLEAQIIEVKSLGDEKSKVRIPFSLTLLTSLKEAYYEQGTFKVILPDGHAEYMFMVPIGVDPESGRMQYEVVYN